MREPDPPCTRPARKKGRKEGNDGKGAERVQAEEGSHGGETPSAAWFVPPFNCRLRGDRTPWSRDNGPKGCKVKESPGQSAGELLPRQITCSHIKRARKHTVQRD